jgi:putative FmdB family regulatory protein
MPIYEYRCGACGQEHEALQKVSEPPLVQCPACGKPQLHKLLSAAGFQLKGSGWYATDFKGNGKKKTEEKKPEQKESKTDSKTETKPKPETKSEAPA